MGAGKFYVTLIRPCDDEILCFASPVGAEGRRWWLRGLTHPPLLLAMTEIGGGGGSATPPEDPPHHLPKKGSARTSWLYESACTLAPSDALKQLRAKSSSMAGSSSIADVGEVAWRVELFGWG